MKQQKIDYTQVDEVIVDLIRNGADRLDGIYRHRKFRDATHAIGIWRAYSTAERRLQSLRKSGVIEYVNGRWHVVAKEGKA